MNKPNDILDFIDFLKYVNMELDKFEEKIGENLVRDVRKKVNKSISNSKLILEEIAAKQILKTMFGEK